MVILKYPSECPTHCSSSDIWYYCLIGQSSVSRKDNLLWLFSFFMNHVGTKHKYNVIQYQSYSLCHWLTDEKLLWNAIFEIIIFLTLDKKCFICWTVHSFIYHHTCISLQRSSCEVYFCVLSLQYIMATCTVLLERSSYMEFTILYWCCSMFQHWLLLLQNFT